MEEEQIREKAASLNGDHDLEMMEEKKVHDDHDHHHSGENINIRAAVAHVVGDVL